MDKMREEFEAWVVSESERTGYEYMDKVLSKFGESYTTTWVDNSWQGWKASRAALCVELNSVVFSRDKNGDGGLMLPARVFKAMNDSGVSYK